MSDKAKSEEAFEEALARAQAGFNARLAMEELMCRNPNWDVNPPCPNCGSFDHFECDA